MSWPGLGRWMRRSWSWEVKKKPPPCASWMTASVSVCRPAAARAPLGRQLPALLLRLDQSLKNVESVTADARRLSSSLGEDLPEEEIQRPIRPGRIDSLEAQGGAIFFPIRQRQIPALEAHPAVADLHRFLARQAHPR